MSSLEVPSTNLEPQKIRLGSFTLSKNYRVHPTPPQSLEIKVGDGIEKYFPFGTISDAMTMSADQFRGNWQSDAFESGLVNQTIEMAVRNHIKDAIEQEESEHEGEPMYKPAYYLRIQDPANNEYKLWVHKNAGLNAANAWNSYVDKKYSDLTEQQRTEFVQKIQNRVIEIYTQAEMDRKPNTDMAHLIDIITQEPDATAIINPEDREILKNIELLMRLANLTYFSTQFLRAEQENNPKRIDPTKTNFTDFKSMVEAKVTEANANSDKTPENELAKDLWEILKAWYGEEKLTGKMNLKAPNYETKPLNPT